MRAARLDALAARGMPREAAEARQAAEAVAGAEGLRRLLLPLPLLLLLPIPTPPGPVPSLFVAHDDDDGGTWLPPAGRGSLLVGLAGLPLLLLLLLAWGDTSGAVAA